MSGQAQIWGICLRYMKIVISGVLVALGLVTGYWMVTRLPWVTVYRDCYNIAYSILNEEHNITRRAWTSDETICLEHKQKLLNAQKCFKNADVKQPLSKLEKDLVMELAQEMAKGTKSFTDMILNHNKQCTYRQTYLDFDPQKNVWF